MYEDIGNFNESFFYLTKGNAMRKQLLNYSIETDQKLFVQLKKAHPKLMEGALNRKRHVAEIVPVFIVGMPRSGTTLVEQIVSSHSEVTGAGELNYVSQFGKSLAIGVTAANVETVSAFRCSYLKNIAKRANGRRFIIDKMPQNFKFLALICAAFPEAKIIHMQREAKATCWSNFKHYFASDGLGYCCNLADTVNYYGLYTDLMLFWQESYGNRIYNLDYDNLTDNPEQEIRRLIAHLGLNWENTCLAPQNNKRAIKTISQQQVRETIYQGSSQVWRKYEPFLNGVFDDL
jgi:hypothetical protein